MKRVLIQSEPFIDPAQFEPGWAWVKWGEWPVWWVDHPERPLVEPSVAIYLLKFTVEAATT